MQSIYVNYLQVVKIKKGSSFLNRNTTTFFCLKRNYLIINEKLIKEIDSFYYCKGRDS